MATATAVALGACGGSSHFANQSRPAVPINLTVAITDTRVSVSPASIGAGPVLVTIANLGSSAESLSVAPAGAGAQPLVSTSPINPQGTATVSVDFSRQGTYEVTASRTAADASTSAPSSMAAAQVRVGPPRASGGSTLLAP
jgi:hypothetical protein